MRPGGRSQGGSGQTCGNARRSCGAEPMEVLQVNATSVNRGAGEGAKKARVAVAVEVESGKGGSCRACP